MSETQQPKRGRGLIIGLILTFVAGLLVMAWLLTGTETGRGLIRPDASPDAIADATPPLPLAGPQSAEKAPALAAPASAETAFRIASLEARLASLESRPSAGGPAASPRVEALLLTLIASRKLEQGEPLGALEGELSARFGTMDAAAVRALSAWSAAPVRLSDLQAGFETVAPSLSGSDGWWDRLTSSLGSLIIVRDETSAATAPAQAVKEARALVQEGKIEAALQRVGRLPQSPAGMRWIADAARLVEAQKGMATLEARALDLTANAAAPVLAKPPVEPLPPSKPL